MHIGRGVRVLGFACHLPRSAGILVSVFFTVRCSDGVASAACLLGRCALPAGPYFLLLRQKKDKQRKSDSCGALGWVAPYDTRAL